MLFGSTQSKVERICALTGDAREMRRLLKKKKNVGLNSMTFDGDWSPMHLAAMNGFVELLDFLINEAGGDPCLVRSNNAMTPLHVGCWKGHIEIVRLLLKRAEVDVDCQTKDGLTCLHFACWSGFYSICELLMQSGASVTLVTNIGQTAFMVAARFGREHVLELFLKTQTRETQQALLAATDNNGLTALSHACLEGKDSSATMLLCKGADPTVVDSQGRGLLKLCRQNTSKLVLQHMQSQGSLEAPEAEPQPPASSCSDADGDGDEGERSPHLITAQSFSYPQRQPSLSSERGDPSPSTLPPRPYRPTSFIHASAAHIDTGAPAEDDQVNNQSGKYSEGAPDREVDEESQDHSQVPDPDPVPGEHVMPDTAIDRRAWLRAAKSLRPADLVADLWGLCGGSVVAPARTDELNGLDDDGRALRLFRLLHAHPSLPLNKLRDLDDRTPLMRCLELNRTLCARVLLHFQAHLYATDGGNNNCAHLCARRGHLAGLQLLHEYISDGYLVSLDFLEGRLDTSAEEDALSRSARGNYHGMMHVLDLFDSLNSAHCTPLLLAVQGEANAEDSMKIVRFLVKTVRVDVFATDDHQRNVLHLCALHRRVSALLFLLHLFLDPGASDAPAPADGAKIIASSVQHREWLQRCIAADGVSDVDASVAYAVPVMLSDLSRSGELPADLSPSVVVRKLLCGYQALYTYAQRRQAAKVRQAIARLYALELVLEAAPSSSPSQTRKAPPSPTTHVRAPVSLADDVYGRVRQQVRALRISSSVPAPAPREYAFTRYFEKKYPTALPSGSSSGSPKKRPVVPPASPQLPAAPLFIHTPSRAGTGDHPHLQIELQVFVGTLNRILDYKANSLQKYFYRWKHRYARAAPASPRPSGPPSDTPIRARQTASPQAATSPTAPRYPVVPVSSPPAPRSPNKAPSSPETQATARRWQAALKTTVAAALGMGTEAVSDNEDLRSMVQYNAEPLWEIFAHFSARGHLQGGLHQHFADELMAVQELLLLLSAFDVYPNLCSHQRLLELLRLQVPRLALPALPKPHSPPKASRGAAPAATGHLSFLDFLQVLVAVSQDLPVAGRRLRLTLLLHSMQSSKGRLQVCSAQHQLHAKGSSGRHRGLEFSLHK